MQLLLVAPLLLGCLPWVLTLVLPRWLVVGSMVLILGVPCLFVAALTLLFQAGLLAAVLVLLAEGYGLYQNLPAPAQQRVARMSHRR